MTKHQLWRLDKMYYTEYGTKELMYEFDELKDIKNPVNSMAPVFHVIYNKWLDAQLPKEVTDSKMEIGGLLANESTTCVVDGKLVNLCAYNIVFYASLYLKDHISVEGTDMNACKKLIGSFRSFVKQQKLEEIVTAARAVIARKDHYLSEEVCSLYSVKSAF